MYFLCVWLLFSIEFVSWSMRLHDIQMVHPYCWWVNILLWIHSSGMSICIVSSSGLLKIMLLWIFKYISFMNMYTFLLWMYLGVEILGHGPCMFSSLVENVSFQKWLPVNTHIRNIWGLLTHVIFHCFYFSRCGYLT